MAVFGADVHLGRTSRIATAAFDVILGFDAAAQALDLLAVDGGTRQHHLEAVVVLRVMAAGDHDAAAAAVLAARGGDVIKHRRGDRTDVHDVEAGGLQAADQRRHQLGAGQAAIAADSHGFFAGIDSLAAECPAEVFGEFFVQGRADDATHVIGLEDGRVNLHEGCLGM